MSKPEPSDADLVYPLDTLLGASLIKQRDQKGFHLMRERDATSDLGISVG